MLSVNATFQFQEWTTTMTKMIHHMQLHHFLSLDTNNLKQVILVIN